MAKLKTLKPKKCRSCGELFTPFSSLAKACSPKCALDTVKKTKQKEFNRETKRRKQAIKSRGDYTKEAQTSFNRYIRERDNHLPCISCNRHHSGQYHAGHYRTVGAHPELRFSEINCHKQCAPCNNHKSGNIVEYRINLSNRITAAEMGWLEGPHEPLKLTIEEIKAIKKKYDGKYKTLISSRNITAL